MKWFSYRNNETQWHSNIITSECECTWRYISVMIIHKYTRVNGSWLYINEYEWTSVNMSVHQWTSSKHDTWTWMYISEHEFISVNMILHQWTWVYITVISEYQWTWVYITVISEYQWTWVYITVISEYQWTWVYTSDHAWVYLSVHKWMWIYISGYVCTSATWEKVSVHELI